jgi:ubiquinone/menaquinone biosynthesis C-methylase UbiE
VTVTACSTSAAASASASTQTPRSIEAHGIDYAENMVEEAKRRLAAGSGLAIEFQHAWVTELP